MTRNTKYICCFSRNDQLFFHIIFNSQSLLKYRAVLSNRVTSDTVSFTVLYAIFTRYALLLTKI